MSDDLKACQEAFEAYIRTWRTDTDEWLMKNADGKYKSNMVELWWGIWQAAWNTRSSAGPDEGLAEDAWKNVENFVSGIKEERARGGDPFTTVEALGNFVVARIAHLRRPQPSAWRPIAEHDGSMKEVLGLDAKGDIHKTWYFAPSSRTRDWWIVGTRNRKWHPTHFMELPPSPPENEALK